MPVRRFPEVFKFLFCYGSPCNQKFICHAAPAVGDAGPGIPVLQVKIPALQALAVVVRMFVHGLDIQDDAVIRFQAFDGLKRPGAAAIAPQGFVNRQEQDVGKVTKGQQIEKSAEYILLVKCNEVPVPLVSIFQITDRDAFLRGKCIFI